MKGHRLFSPLHPYPDSWYCLGLSASLAEGDMRTEAFCGQEIILFRGENGELAAIDPYCSHLGSHLGGGKVVENTVSCPFHGFRFNGKGECIATGYGSQPPRDASIKHWPVEEVNGLIFVYYHAGSKAPNYTISAINTQDYMPLKIKSWVVNTHIQDVVENAVDTGHVNIVHGYEDVTLIEKSEIKGPIMDLSVRVEAKRWLMNRSKPLTVYYDVTLYGLGCSAVNIYLPAFDMRIQAYVLATPIEANKVLVRSAIQLKKGCDLSKFSRLLKLLPRFIAEPLVNHILSIVYMQDFKQDIAVWNNKIYLEQPRLVSGDGPIHLFRKFAKQFYSTQSAQKTITLVDANECDDPHAMA